MAGKIIKRVGLPHDCKGLPNNSYMARNGLAPGTEWQCDDCAQKWVFKYDHRTGGNWFRFIEITPTNDIVGKK